MENDMHKNKTSFTGLHNIIQIFGGQITTARYVFSVVI